MAVSPGDIITAAQFNTLRNRMANLLGTGVSDFGYGQSVASAEVSSGTVITASRLETLKSDIDRIHRHQTGSASDLDAIETGNIIGADESGDVVFDSQGGYTIDNPNTTKGYNDYLTLLDTLETNRFDIAATQQEVDGDLESDTRSTDWGSPSYSESDFTDNDDETPSASIDSAFTVSFSTSAARRHFFNSGGEIRISGVVSDLDSGSASYQRNLGWQEMINNPDAVVFGHNYVGALASGATNIELADNGNFGNYQLTSSYTEIFRKNANSGVYEYSYWTVEARNDSSTTIRFRVRLVDAGPEGNVYPDLTIEPVTADITMNYGARRALGNPEGDSVTVDAPTFTVINTFQ